MTVRKTVTKEDIEAVAVSLMDKNGGTTTLDVKNELRTMGFWAEQNSVSQFMAHLCDEKGWDFVVEDGHRVYAHIPNDVKIGKVPQNAQPITQGDDGWGVGCQPDQGTWVVKMDASVRSIPGFVASPIKMFREGALYPEHVTRDAARYAFAKLFKLKNPNVDTHAIKDCTRAHRITKKDVE